MSSEAQTMEKESKHTLTPELRFPEFRDKGGWSSKRLDKVGRLIRGLTYSSKDVAEDGLLVLRSSNIQDERLVLSKDLVFVKKECNDEQLLNNGDIAICMSNGSKALVGKNAEYKGDYDSPLTVGAFCSIFRPDDSFAKYLLQTQQYTKFIAVAIGGGNINNLRPTDLESLKFPTPPLETEQQKIADCLGSLDALIEAEGRKLAALRDHKRGLMQQLFPQPGQTQPRLRFPEFRDKGEWEEKPLVELVKFASGGTPPKTDQKFWDGDIPWISASTMYDTVIYDSELKVTQEAIGNGTRLAAKGSILILVRGSMLFKRVPICIAERDVAFNQDVKSIRPKRGIVTSYLLYHLIASESRIAINATGIGAGKIDTEHLKSLIIGVPSSAEQHRIADCLTALDTQITAQAAKIDALKQHKRGLMQQLFPAPEEQ